MRKFATMFIGTLFIAALFVACGGSKNSTDIVDDLVDSGGGGGNTGGGNTGGGSVYKCPDAHTWEGHTVVNTEAVCEEKTQILVNTPGSAAIGKMTWDVTGVENSHFRQGGHMADSFWMFAYFLHSGREYNFHFNAWLEGSNLTTRLTSQGVKSGGGLEYEKFDTQYDLNFDDTSKRYQVNCSWNSREDWALCDIAEYDQNGGLGSPIVVWGTGTGAVYDSIDYVAVGEDACTHCGGYPTAEMLVSNFRITLFQ